MRFNPFKSEAKEPVLLAVTPPRTGERTLLGVENLLASIAVPEPFSLELAGDEDGVTVLARCLGGQVVRQQIATHYPQASVHDVEPQDDPLRLGEGEQAWALTLRSSGPEYVPLRSFGDDDLLEAGSDPLLALLGALAGLGAGERVVARLRLRSLGPEWSQGHQVRAHQPAVRDRTDSYQISESRRHRVEIAGASVLGVAAVGALQGYRWWQAGEEWKTLALGAGADAHARTGRLGVGALAALAQPRLRPAADPGEGLAHRLRGRHRGRGDRAGGRREAGQEARAGAA